MGKLLWKPVGQLLKKLNRVLLHLSTPRYISKKSENILPHKNICMFYYSFIVARSGNNTSSYEWTNKMWYIKQ